MIAEKQKFKKLTAAYLEADRVYKNYVRQFCSGAKAFNLHEASVISSLRIERELTKERRYRFILGK